MQSKQLNNVNKKYIFISVISLIILIELFTSSYFRYFWFHYIDDAKMKIGNLNIQLDEDWYPEFNSNRNNSENDTKFLILDTISFRNIKDVEGTRIIDIDLISYDVARNLKSAEDMMIKVDYGDLVLKNQWHGVADENYMMFFSEKFKLLITVNNERDIYQIINISKLNGSEPFKSM